MVSTVVHQRPWLVVVEVTHLVTRRQPDPPVAGLTLDPRLVHYYEMQLDVIMVTLG